MRTHTTYTDCRRIMKLHNDGLNAEEITQQVFIDVAAVENVIKARTAKKTKKSKTTE